MLGQAGYGRSAAAAAAAWTVSLVLGVTPAAPQSGAPEIDVPAVAPLQLVPPVDIPPLRLPVLRLPPLQSPIESPSPIRLPKPQEPPRGGSAPTAGSGGGAGDGSSVGPTLGGATTPRAGEAPGPSPARRGGRGPVLEPRRAQDRSEGGRAGKGDATAPADSGTSLSDRVGDVIGGVPWQFTVTIGALAILAFLMAGRSAVSAARAARLTRQRAELRSDVGALQSALLPAVPQAIGDVRLSVAYRPAEGPAAGGDFHDVVQLDNGRFALILGDVSGHGRQALAVTALVHYTVRAYLAAGLQPRLALRLTDESLEGKLGDDFVTVLAAIYDPAASTLEYASAGHPVPIVVGKQADHPVDGLTSPPIGIGPRTGDRETCVSICSGSRICLFTDGLTEARNENGALLEREGLDRILTESGDSLEASALLTQLTDQTTAGADDMTACLLNPLAASGTGAITEELEVDPAFESSDDLQEFLAQCALDPEQVQDALAETRLQVALGTPILMRVARRAGGASWEVVPAGAGSTSPLTAALA